MEPANKVPELESETVEQWLICPVCKQPNPAGTLNCQHCWGAALYSVKPVTSEELETIMAREQAHTRRLNLIKTVSVSILAPLLLFTVIFLSIFNFTDLILAPPQTFSSSPLPGEWTMFRHDLSRTGSIDSGIAQPVGELKWSFFPLEEELAEVQKAMDTMMAENALTSVETTKATSRMSSFPAGNPLYPRYLDTQITRGQYSCDANGSVKLESGIHSSPAVVDGIVYFGSQDSFLYAVNADTGTKLWEFQAGSFIESSPAVTGGIIYFGSNDGYFYALNATNGEMLWNFYTGRANRSSPAVADGMVFFGSDNSRIYGLDARTGEKIWEYKTGGYVVSSPAVANGIIYAGSTDRYIYALQANNGRFRLKVRVNDVSSSPAIRDGIVYFNSQQRLYAIDGKARNWPGEHYLRPYWIQFYAFHLAPAPPPISGFLWALGLNSTSYSSPIAVDDTVYTTAGNFMYLVDTTEREILWTFTANGSLRSSPALGNGILYVGSEDSYLYAVNASSGNEYWRFATGGAITSSPALVNGIVYVTSHDGKLYAIR